MNNTICECEKPIPQATLSHACQNCYKVLKEYVMETPIIVIKDKVIETTVTASPDDSIKTLLDIALEQTNNSPVTNFYCMIAGFNLQMKFKELKFRLVVEWDKKEKYWILTRVN